MYCGKCGNDVGNEAFCSKCGNRTDGSQQYHAPNVVYVHEKSEGVAAVLSVLWAGLGQIYVGRIGRGLAIMLAAFMIAFLSIIAIWFLPVLFIAGILALVFWIWNVYDAYKLAQQYNSSFKATGNRPW
ncbi:MAG: hypothetical protein FWF40_02650 [Methanomassiliicoccaceae archaeon]|jgi:TM2 domain-containing membrane protein YozV|nr:hypothetical protein [Methanomassiliicoccaceae archaeon]